MFKICVTIYFTIMYLFNNSRFTKANEPSGG